MPLTSMTGYADRPGTAVGVAWTWEARSVNGRGLDLRIRLPEGFESLDAGLRQQVAAAIARGSVTVTLGDFVFADDDGVVVVESADLDRIVDTAKDIAFREGAQAERLLKGDLLRTQLDLAGYIAKRQSDSNYTFRDHLKTFGGAIEI